jgi:nitrogen fixation protein NifB
LFLHIFCRKNLLGMTIALHKTHPDFFDTSVQYIMKCEQHACARSMQIDSLVLPIASQAVCGKRFNSCKASAAMPPAEAVAWIGELIKGGKTVHGVNLCGPGDALAAPDSLFAALTLLRQRYPACRLHLTTVGLVGAADAAAALAEYNIAQINLQVEAVDAAVLEKIYAWIRPGKKTVPLRQATALLVNAQAEAVAAFKQAGLSVTIQSTVYPGVNEQHIAAIAEKMAELGADSMTLLPFKPLADQEQELPACSPALLEQAKKEAAAHLRLTDYDSVCLTPPGSGSNLAGMLLPKPSKERPNVAVVSSNGMEVDLHLGHAAKILIYGPRGGDELPSLLTMRDAPESGAGDSRWKALANECLFDCFALVAAKAGENPQKVLAEQGIKVLLAEDGIEGLVDVLYGGGKKQKCKK